ncbi:predicted protein [Plenodomus lingam JN3]|uniref:Predicted protein n=1 Tax=Leptosphaeria maculans (strain JN3 / isolate v23.1.3 / race Av1-4-5-6-7-8) TaxID=985895 RepID=E5A1U8_LEPMJ|nr:predicted protein [Plenodomus lingam JN3]CBX97665.1 predicted protein [Plenodomus lingam JN3]
MGKQLVYMTTYTHIPLRDSLACQVESVQVASFPKNPGRLSLPCLTPADPRACSRLTIIKPVGPLPCRNCAPSATRSSIAIAIAIDIAIAVAIAIPIGLFPSHLLTSPPIPLTRLSSPSSSSFLAVLLAPPASTCSCLDCTALLLRNSSSATALRPLPAHEAPSSSKAAPMLTMASNGPLTGSPPSLPVPAQNSNYLENGRWYHGFRRGIYMYPCDEVGNTPSTTTSHHYYHYHTTTATATYHTTTITASLPLPLLLTTLPLSLPHYHYPPLPHYHYHHHQYQDNPKKITTTTITIIATTASTMASYHHYQFLLLHPTSLPISSSSSPSTNPPLCLGNRLLHARLRLTRHTARKGPHGHLSQTVCRRTERPAAPSAHAAHLAAPHPRRGLWDGHLGNRHGRQIPERRGALLLPMSAPPSPPADVKLQVLGLDLVNIQPEKIPPNLRFRVPRDYESPWLLGEDSWDLIHLRMACGSVTSWPELYQKIFAHLKPGTGYVEHVEIDMEPRCDDGSLPDDSMLKRWYEWLADATHRVARPIAYEHRTRQLLQQAGFIDIQETVIRVPYNSWPNDPHQKDIGRWYNLGITEGLEALTFAPLTRVYQWDLNTVVRPILDSVRREICNRKFHAYNNIHIWTARRPQQ